MTSRSVFVSYSQPDQATALGIVSHLEAHEVPCWVAPRDVQPGTEWAEQIVEAIAGACIMVLVFSASANGSPQVRREVERAVHKGLIVLPFRIEEVLPIKSLEYFLSSQHWLDAFPPPREPYYERLCAFLERALATHPAHTARLPLAPAPGTATGPQPALAAATISDTLVPGASMPRFANPDQLGRLEVELARYIGPVARHLVRRASVNAADLPQLILRLSAEVDSDKDRQKFVSACQALAGTPR